MHVEAVTHEWPDTREAGMDEREDPEEAARGIDEVVASIRLPLENVEFTIEQFLLENGCRLDTETRMLLAGVRDCVGRVAVSTRRLEHRAGTARRRSRAA